MKAFAGTPQVPRKTFWCLQQSCKLHFLLLGICRSSASSIFLFLAFAEVLQTPFFSFGHLQKSCKLHFSLWGLCRSSANSIFLFWAFAEVLQAPFFPFGSLQKFCKLHFSLLGICRSSASLLVWRKPKEGSGKNDRVLGDKCIGSNGFASAKKRQSVGIDEDGA